MGVFFTPTCEKMRQKARMQGVTQKKWPNVVHLRLFIRRYHVTQGFHVSRALLNRLGVGRKTTLWILGYEG